MSACRYDREREAYLRDGEVCRVDDYGDPTFHCTARRSCTSHIGRDELTCPRCVGKTRGDIRAIVARSCELLPEATELGRVDSEAANLAGPATDVRQWSERRVAMLNHLDAWLRHGRISEAQWMYAHNTMEEDDERHPYTVLARWVQAFSEDYGLEMPTLPRHQIGIERAGAFLEQVLHRMAQDPEQDFRNFRDEIRKCRSHLEAVLRDSLKPETGAPCPDCKHEGRIVPMRREYPHWCEDRDCERFHYSVMRDPLTGEIVPDTTGDWWICPQDAEHNRPHADYEEWIEARMEAKRDANRSA